MPQRQTKLTDDAVRQICILIRQGVRYRAIGAQFGVTVKVVLMIAKGRAWRHVTGGSLTRPECVGFPGLTARRVREFWGCVDKTDGCWLWTGGLTQYGYGQFYFGSKRALAHQVSFTLHKGPVPEGLWVLHTCDVRNCVNPNHLYAGNHQDNVRDARERTRYAAGERNGTRKLTDAAVREIRLLASSGVSQKALAAQFGVSASRVSKVVHREAWTHVE